MPLVCSSCGTPVAGAAGRWFHTEVPPAALPDHDPSEPISQAEWRLGQGSSDAIVTAQAIAHAQDIRRRMSVPGLEGIVWNQDARALVTLLHEIERLQGVVHD